MSLLAEEVAPPVSEAPVFSTVPAWDHAGLPRWFAERQIRAWQEFNAAPMPHRKVEMWRYADIRRLAFESFVTSLPFAGKMATAASFRSQGLPRAAAKVVFGNDSLVSKGGELPSGVVIQPLREALQEHGELIERHFMAQRATLGGEKFYALHLAALRGGIFIHVPSGVEVEQPIELHQWLGGMNASVFPHTLVVAGRGAKVTVIDYFQSLASEPGFACGVTDLAADDGATISYVCCQRWSRKVKAIHFSSTTTARDAKVKSCFINLGCDWSRTENLCLAAGAGSHSEMLSLAVTEGQQEIDCRTRQVHSQPHTTSNLLFKNVLFDTSRTIFGGLIFVEPGAHYTDAYQTCRNLLLSDEAEANAMPGLEINADQVKCSHGSTSGPLQEEEVFYLRARGIPVDVAQQLLAFGFCLEVIERIGHSEIEAAMTAMIEEKFRRMRRE